ncbi:thiamine-phosphate kinase [Nitrosopumilus sp. Nsub]|uniref:thiamine-phosphate kinase n=1 Tax=Nitrosopumilus sp. Nsub TaxID=1776294 RepID=UPI000830B100|nr:thiamine-phosphate kinase [Nitrosopumilus sp. Nsub]
MTKLNENQIINIFQKKLGNKKFVSEDVEKFTLGKTNIVAKTDTMVQSTDIPNKMELSDAARKSVIACVSDFACKGVKPEYGIISINLPKSIPKNEINNIVKGFKNACKEYNISIIGGDTNEGKEIVFNVCIFGNSKKIVTRKGSNKGDLIFTTGPFGYTSVGLKILLGNNKKMNNLIKKSIKSVTYPKPKLNYGLKNKKYFTSSMDSSDGLSTTLNEMAKQSKKKFVINKIPINRDLENYFKKQKNDLNSAVFHGGEEYEFVFTIPSKFKKIIIKNAKLLKTPIFEIGYVAVGNGVYLENQNGETKLKDLGWRHFK